ncbi:phosphotransferase family protein [Mycolicibacterium vaccae]|uniref:phosphotransferase family protein n=1 Tax=Mycolicibacterium vaccae TaxID=1810 RepID=UPI003CFC7C92
MPEVPVLRPDTQQRLVDWLHARLPEADVVRIEGLDRVDFGHSAEMMTFTVVSAHHGGEARRDVVLRLRPTPPALLEPYNLARQFVILQALEETAVRAPRVLWLEGGDTVLGRPFLVMERVYGDVYEMESPDADDRTVRRMCESLAEQLAAIHTVDLDATGLRALDDGARHLHRELSRWAAELHRVRRAPLPALERLLSELRRTTPAPRHLSTLVHGDAKPGNFAFTDGEVSAVFDWEMTTVGDPLTDIGWLELLWMQPVGITSHPGAMNIEDLIAHYERAGGAEVVDRPWYRAFNAFKMAVICLVGAMLVDEGHSDDPKLALAAYGTSMLTAVGLGDLGVGDSLDDGPVLPRQERLDAVLQQG